MGYFFRRSAKFGPFRLNFSKSGVGASVGVKGARLTMTPRGTAYITVGSHGFYYRETLLQAKHTPVQPTPPAPGLPPATAQSDEIATAEASELVDSSRESLINTLNERARMFNPAGLLYTAAAITFVLALAAFSAVGNAPGRQMRATLDEYSAVVARYGQPNYLVVSKPFGIVTVRTAVYSTARTEVVFVPTGCSESYDEAMAALKIQSKLNKRAIDSMARCVPLPDSVWTLVEYIDSSRQAPIAADLAKSRLGDITIKLTSLPTVEIRSVPIKQVRGVRKNHLSQEITVESIQRTLAGEEQRRRASEVAQSQASRSTFEALLGSLGLFVVGFVVNKHNQERRTSRLFYELDDAQQHKYGAVQGAFNYLAKSHRVWRIEGQSATADWKRNAGASSLVRRKPITVGCSNPPLVQTNVVVPCITVGHVRLFFLPDVILFWERGSYGAIGYDDFTIEQGFTRFIEEEQVPADATVVDRTWRYVNRNGGPDRRFNNNRELPVAQYGVLVLSSSRGLNIHLNTSSAQISAAFADYWRGLNRSTEAKQEQPRGGNASPDLSASPRTQAYRLLGLGSEASAAEISAAYHRLAQMYHPDKVVGLAPEFQVLADKRMKEINAAYEMLKSAGNAA